MQQYHDPIFLREIWGLFIAGTIVLLLRLVVRLRTVGFRGLQGDDYFAVGGLITYACATIAVRCVYFLGTNQDFTTEYMASLTPTQQDKIALGSKLEMLGW